MPAKGATRTPRIVAWVIFAVFFASTLFWRFIAYPGYDRVRGSTIEQDGLIPVLGYSGPGPLLVMADDGLLVYIVLSVLFWSALALTFVRYIWLRVIGYTLALLIWFLAGFLCLLAAAVSYPA